MNKTNNVADDGGNGDTDGMVTVSNRSSRYEISRIDCAETAGDPKPAGVVCTLTRSNPRDVKTLLNENKTRQPRPPEAQVPLSRAHFLWTACDSSI